MLCFLVCSLQPCDHLLGNCWPLGSLFSCIFLCCCHFSICVLIHIRTKGGAGIVKNCLGPPVFPRLCFFVDLLVIYVSRLSLLYCLVCSLQPCDHLLGKLLALLCVMFSCVFVTFYSVSQVRCGSLLYRFLICVFCTFPIKKQSNKKNPNNWCYVFAFLIDAKFSLE